MHASICSAVRLNVSWGPRRVHRHQASTGWTRSKRTLAWNDHNLGLASNLRIEASVGASYCRPILLFETRKPSQLAEANELWWLTRCRRADGVWDGGTGPSLLLENVLQARFWSRVDFLDVQDAYVRPRAYPLQRVDISRFAPDTRPYEFWHRQVEPDRHAIQLQEANEARLIYRTSQLHGARANIVRKGFDLESWYFCAWLLFLRFRLEGRPLHRCGPVDG